MAILTLPRLIARDAVGLGDVKLVGVVGMGVGVTGVAVVVVVAVITAAAVMSLVVVLSGGRRRRSLPFAPCVAAGTLAVLAVNPLSALA